MGNDPSFEGSKILVEQLRKHEEELDKELLAKNQELVDLKGNLEDKVKRLEATIATKDEELKKKETQYSKFGWILELFLGDQSAIRFIANYFILCFSVEKCMEKAKSVITTLEPTAAPGMDNVKSEEMEKARAVREMEDKLLQSAFYQYSLAIHHKAVEARNRTLLGQHRQNVASRRKSEI